MPSSGSSNLLGVPGTELRDNNAGGNKLTAVTLNCLEHQLHPHGAVAAGQHQHVCHHRVATAEVEREREPQRRGRGRLHCWRRQHQVRHERGEDDTGAGRGVEQQARVL